MCFGVGGSLGSRCSRKGRISVATMHDKILSPHSQPRPTPRAALELIPAEWFSKTAKRFLLTSSRPYSMHTPQLACNAVSVGGAIWSRLAGNRFGS